MSSFKMPYNVPRVADGLPAHKYRKLYEKGGLAATRCYVKRRLAKYTPARLRHTPFSLAWVARRKNKKSIQALLVQQQPISKRKKENKLFCQKLSREKRKAKKIIGLP
jgi:hypothetical protein